MKCNKCGKEISADDYLHLVTCSGKKFDFSNYGQLSPRTDPVIPDFKLQTYTCPDCGEEVLLWLKSHHNSNCSGKKFDFSNYGHLFPKTEPNRTILDFKVDDYTCPDCGVSMPSSFRFFHSSRCTIKKTDFSKYKLPLSAESDTIKVDYTMLTYTCPECGKLMSYNEKSLHDSMCSGKKFDLSKYDNLLPKAKPNPVIADFNVQTYTCPDCGEEVLLWLKSHHNSNCSGKKFDFSNYGHLFPKTEPNRTIFDFKVDDYTCPDCGVSMPFAQMSRHIAKCPGKTYDVLSYVKDLNRFSQKTCSKCGQWIGENDSLHQITCSASDRLPAFSTLDTRGLLNSLRGLPSSDITDPIITPLLSSKNLGKSLLIGFPNTKPSTDIGIPLYVPTALSSYNRDWRIHELESEVRELRTKLLSAGNRRLVSSGMSVILHIADLLCPPPLSFLLKAVGVGKTYIDFFSAIENRYAGDS